MLTIYILLCHSFSHIDVTCVLYTKTWRVSILYVDMYLIICDFELEKQHISDSIFIQREFDGKIKRENLSSMWYNEISKQTLTKRKDRFSWKNY